MNVSTEKNPQAKRTRRYVDEVFRQIQEKPDIIDVLILNQYGNPLKTTMNFSRAIEFAGYASQLFDKACSAVLKMDPEDEIVMLRVRTKNNETLITPDGKITAVVVQNAQDQIQHLNNNI